VLTIDALIGTIDSLPPFPRNLVALTELLNQPDVDVDQMVALIQYDPALTALVMRLCNSAYFGAASPVSDLHEATTRPAAKGLRHRGGRAVAALGDRRNRWQVHRRGTK